MPSFDIESKVDNHEISNAVDQANRELSTRFDFKGVDAKFEFADNKITLTAPEEFQATQMQDILNSKISKRGISVQALDPQPIDKNLAKAVLVINLKQGVDQPSAKKIVKFIKDNKFKVQASIQGEQIRVTGKKRDDLQDVIAALKDENFKLPLQFGNFRD